MMGMLNTFRGVSMTKVSVLAKATGTATMTVYRHIQKLGVRLDGHLVKKGSSEKGFFGKMRTCPSGFRFARGFLQSRTLEVSRNR